MAPVKVAHERELAYPGVFSSTAITIFPPVYTNGVASGISIQTLATGAGVAPLKTIVIEAAGTQEEVVA